MKKRSTKNFLTRLTAFIVMALMLVPIIPLTANAESTGYQDGDLLLKMNALDGTATYNPYGVKLGTSTAKYAKLDEDDKTKMELQPIFHLTPHQHILLSIMLN